MCNVKVESVKGITSIKLNEKNLYINVDENEKITSIINETETESIIWESSNENIVKIIQNSGNEIIVKGINKGEATITAKNYLGTISDSCIISVDKFKNLEELNMFSYAQNSGISSTEFGFTTNWNPSNCDRKTFDYTSGFGIGKWTGSGSYEGKLSLDFSKYASKIVYANQANIQFKMSAQSGSNIKGTVRVGYREGTNSTLATEQATNIETGVYVTKNITIDLKRIGIKNMQFIISRI